MFLKCLLNKEYIYIYKITPSNAFVASKQKILNYPAENDNSKMNL